MIAVVLLLAVLAAVGLLVLLTRKGKRPQARGPATSRAPAPIPTQAPAPAALRRPAEAAPDLRANPAPTTSALRQPSIVRVASTQVEAMLKDFTLTRATDLPADDAATIMALLDQIPRPPSALHKLVSPVFLANASTADLSEMVMAEPQVAAKVLATVNSPFYGLSTPPTSIGQAVTFLGLNTVRSICLQYLLDESFQSKDPEVRKIFDGLWQASALASELCFRLAQALQLPEAGSLATQVVLSFLGPVTSHALLPKKTALAMASQSFLERTRTEQDQLGLSAAELGSLLMQKWRLPPGVVEPVRDIDRVLLMPCEGPASVRNARMAFCYLCARLGEKLASGEVSNLAEFALEQQSGPDLYYLQSYLQQPGLQRLPDMLRKPELVASIHSMVLAMRTAN